MSAVSFSRGEFGGVVSAAGDLDREYILVDGDWDSSEVVDRLIDEMRVSGVVSVDTETTGTNVFEPGFELLGLVFSPDGLKSYYFPVAHESFGSAGSFSWREEAADLMGRVLDSGARLVYHNASYDMLVLHRELGFALERLHGDDTMLMGFLANENVLKSLKAQAGLYLGVVEAPFDLDEVVFGNHFLFEAADGGAVIQGAEGVSLRPDYVDHLFDVFMKHHNYAVPFKSLEQFMRAFAGLAKNHKVEHYDYKGKYPGSFKHVPPVIASVYAGDDAINTWLLHHYFSANTFAVNDDLHRLYHEVELPAMFVMTAATAAGVLLDEADLLDMQVKLAERLDLLEKESLELITKVFDSVGESEHVGLEPAKVLSSPKQLGKLLYEVFEFPVVEKTPKGSPSTSKSTLVALEGKSPKRHTELTAEIRRLLELKRQTSDIKKIKSTYVDKYLEDRDADGFLHPWYNTVGAVSGRMSSNFQQLPRLTAEELAKKPWLEGIDIRRAMIAPEGFVFVSADIIAMEMTVAAWVADEQVLKDLINEGKDLHVNTAKGGFDVGHHLSDQEFKDIYPLERQDAKILNFALLYAGSAFTLQKSFGFDKAKAVMLEKNFKKTYPALTTWMESVYGQLESEGFVTYPRFGFVKRLDAPSDSLRRYDNREYNRRMRAAMRTCLNAVIQGTSAYIVKEALVKVDAQLRAEGLNAMVIAQVHDELIVLAHTDHAMRAQEILISYLEQDLDGVALKADAEIKLNLSSSARVLVESDFTFMSDGDGELDRMLF